MLISSSFVAASIVTMYNKAFYFSAFLISAISVFLLAAFSIFSADDGYVLMRHAENIIQYGEWSFNLTEKVRALATPFLAMVIIIVSFFTGSLILPGKKMLIAL